MKNLFKLKFLLSFFFIVFLFWNSSVIFADSITVPTISTIASVTSTSKCSNNSFFGLEPWYHFLKTYNYTVRTSDTTSITSCGVCFNILGSSATIATPNSNNCSTSTSSSIPLVLLAIIDDLLRVAGLLAVVYLLVASFKFITSSGNPEAVAKARKTVIYSLAGLVIAVSAISIITYLGDNLIK